ncbi:type I pantothenate kinase, partial [Xanthomonas citri pv. citri]|nr:type I pantothenate kinase [Xanthomonas citri pv. citri]
MKNKELNLHTLYTQHNRESWSGFGGHLSIAVSEEEAKAVEGLNDYLSV